MIASIIVDIHLKQVNRVFDYLVPKHLETVLSVGYRVKVLFGKRVVVGFVVGLKEKTSYSKKLNEIVDVVDVYPVLNQEFIDMAFFMADNYFTYYSTALQTMIPTALKVKYQKKAILVNSNPKLMDLFKNRKELIIDHLPKEELELIYDAVKDGNVVLDTHIKKNRNEKKISYVYINDSTITPKSKRGQELLDYMLELNEPTPISILVEDSGFSKNVIQTLIQNGILKTYEKEYLKDELLDEEVEPLKEMTELQKECYKKLKLGFNHTYLLHGITGSGKTLLYMNWIEDALKEGKQALLLVPEISLTPQMKSLFIKRFGSAVSILHSKLSIYDKYSSWKKILNGEVQIVIGARSAIFAPLSNLGIIIIDEEHEATYIQENNPRYDALELAKLRSKTHQCPLVLGSATPKVTDYYKAILGEYELLSLPIRINQRPLPSKSVIDMTLELKSGNKSVFSEKLKKALINTYQRKEQSILFLNRRGHSSFVMCRNCGEVINCPHCDVSLTYHSASNLLKCHYCGFSKPNVSSCPACGSGKIRFVGSGTEKVTEEISRLLPEARVLRVDMDTVSKISDYDTIFSRFKNQEADVLVGTQMIAKGLDFENVTLVGLVNADIALHYPSYDAHAVAYNLIEQVSGRAGRGSKPGEVIIQTYQPKHFVIQSSVKNDYEHFFNQEISARKISKMPPFSEAVEIMFQSKRADLAFKEAQNMAYALKQVSVESEVLGPAEAPIFKLNDVFRFTLQVRIVEDEVLDKVKEIYPLYQNNKEVDIKIIRM